MARKRRSAWRRGAARVGTIVAAVAALFVPVGGPGPAQGQGGGATLVRVEEDWSLTVNQPDAHVAAPQVSTQMARAPWVPRYCNLHLNSPDLPFASGGVQIQSWLNNQSLNVGTGPNGAVMATQQ